MSLSTLRRHPLLPWLIALAAFALIETAVQVAVRPTPVERGDIVVVAAKRHDVVALDRWIIREKLRALRNDSPTIVFAERGSDL